jgi:hypothetical protein
MTRKAVHGGRSAERSTPNQPSSLKPFLRRVVGTALSSIALSFLGAGLARAADQPRPRPEAKALRARAGDTYAKASLGFEPNRGQADTRVQFLSRGDGYKLFLTSGEADLVLSRPDSPAGAGTSRSEDILRMRLLGASATASATGLDPEPGIVNYFVGNDPSRWRTGIPTFGKVNYADVYPGIDLLFYGNQRQLEYDFVVKPGANPATIAWFFRGAQPSLGKDGSLELNASGDPTGKPLQFLAPVAYQIVDGQRRPVSVS